MTRWKPIAIILALALTGCAGVATEAVERIRATNDITSGIELRGPCLARLGAWSRLAKAKRRVVLDYVEDMCP